MAQCNVRPRNRCTYICYVAYVPQMLPKLISFTPVKPKNLMAFCQIRYYIIQKSLLYYNLLGMKVS